MPRVNRVEKARKDQGTCRCGDAIPVGSPYVWWKFRHGGKHRRCGKPSCYPRPSDLTSSDKLSRVYAAQESIEDALGAFETLDDLKGVVEGAASDIKDVAEEYRESAENVREHFSESPQADECEEKADDLDCWADLVSDCLDSVEDEPDPTCDDCDGSGQPECEQCGGEGVETTTCQTCMGKGEVDGEECDPCAGDGESDTDCVECSGFGTLECPTCDGSGESSESSALSEWRESVYEIVTNVLGDCPV